MNRVLQVAIFGAVSAVLVTYLLQPIWRGATG